MQARSREATYISDDVGTAQLVELVTFLPSVLGRHREGDGCVAIVLQKAMQNRGRSQSHFPETIIKHTVKEEIATVGTVLENTVQMHSQFMRNLIA